MLKLDSTLKAIQEQRVWQMVDCDCFEAQGTQCTNCLALSATESKTCAYCGEAVREVRDIVERAERCVIEMHGKVECVRGLAATRLQEVGSIGALEMIDIIPRDEIL